MLSLEARHRKIIIGNMFICTGIVFSDVFSNYIAYGIPMGFIVLGLLFFLFGIMLRLMILHPEDRRLCMEEKKEENALLRKWRIKIPPAAIVIIIINIIVFIKTGNNDPWKAVLSQRGIEVLDGQVWRLITAMFTHDTFKHIIGNMLLLFFFAQFTEYLTGSLKFLAAYFFSGLTASVTALISLPEDVYCLGSSGALFGIAGYLTGLSFYKKEYIFYTVSGMIIPFAAYQFTFNLIIPGNAAICAHLGGFAGGIIFALITGKKTHLKHNIEEFERHVF